MYWNDRQNGCIQAQTQHWDISTPTGKVHFDRDRDRIGKKNQNTEVKLARKVLFCTKVQTSPPC